LKAHSKYKEAPPWQVEGWLNSDHPLSLDELKAFTHEYRLKLPIGIDLPNGRGSPATMTAYQMQGTPTLILIDRYGRIRRQVFGQYDDLSLGAEIMALILED